MINFSCDEGLLPIEPITSVCQDTGLWVPDPIETVCYPPQVMESTTTSSCENVTNINVVVESLTVMLNGTEAKFRCREGLVPQSVVTAICGLHDLTWSPNPNEYICNNSDYRGELKQFPKYSDH